LIGFLVFVHLKLYPVPEDLFTGPMFEKTESRPIFSGGPAIFRQSLVTALLMSGSGLGFAFSAVTLGIDTLGIGVALLAPGIAASVLLVELWKSKALKRR